MSATGGPAKLYLARPPLLPILPNHGGNRKIAPAHPSPLRPNPPVIRAGRGGGGGGGLCNARRRVRYEDEDEEYGHNSEIAMLESYSETMSGAALLVRATVDDEEEVVLVFKGFSSLLSSRTLPDPSKSILPQRAVIQSIDVVKGPFNPSNIEYLERGLTWEAFKSRFQLNEL